MDRMSDNEKIHRGLEPEVTEKLRKQTAELGRCVEGGDYAGARTLINELG